MRTRKLFTHCSLVSTSRADGLLRWTVSSPNHQTLKFSTPRVIQRKLCNTGILLDPIDHSSCCLASAMAVCSIHGSSARIRQYPPFPIGSGGVGLIGADRHRRGDRMMYAGQSGWPRAYSSSAHHDHANEMGDGLHRGSSDVVIGFSAGPLRAAGGS